MTLKKYLSLMIIATLVCWATFIFVLNTINPEITNFLGFLFFYASLFLAVSGTASILGFVIRFWLLRQKLAFYSVKTAFRQAFLFGVLIILSLIFLANNLFTWTNIIFIVIILSLLEFFFISYKRNNV
ncbi:MAG: hypothetical protein K9M44_03155 [Candidatus Pacebacteria bacterium]|nr:hypothetical protein [Candidatus Paceibacterota bacterium]